MSKFERWTYPLLVVLAVPLVGCVHGREGFMNKGGDRRAAFELKCGGDALRVVELDGFTVGVDGCGQSAVYKLVETGRGVWDWVRN